MNYTLLDYFLQNDSIWETIPLLAIPAQKLRCNINNKELDITLKNAGDIVLMDLSIDNEVIFKGMLCKINLNMFAHFRYRVDKETGLFFCQNKKINKNLGAVNYKDFETSCELLYFYKE